MEACWGQGLHSHGNEDIALSTVSAHGDHSVAFIVFIKDALLIWMRAVRPPALITLPASPFLGAQQRTEFRSKDRIQIKGHTWLSQSKYFAMGAPAPPLLCHGSILTLPCSSSAPQGITPGCACRAIPAAPGPAELHRLSRAG